MTLLCLKNFDDNNNNKQGRCSDAAKELMASCEAEHKARSKWERGRGQFNTHFGKMDDQVGDAFRFDKLRFHFNNVHHLSVSHIIVLHYSNFRNCRNLNCTASSFMSHRIHPFEGLQKKP